VQEAGARGNGERERTQKTNAQDEDLRSKNLREGRDWLFVGKGLVVVFFSGLDLTCGKKSIPPSRMFRRSTPVGKVRYQKKRT